MGVVDARLLLHSLGKMKYNGQFVRSKFGTDQDIKNINVESLVKEALS